MVRRIFRIIGYSILFAVNGWALWYFHSFLNLSIMVLMVFLPVISIVATKLVADRVTVQWDGPVENMNKNEEYLVRLQLLNPVYIGVMSCKLDICVSNLFYGTAKNHELKAPLRARVGQTITYPVTSTQSGRIEFRVMDVVLEDFFGFTAFRREFKDSYIIYVLPDSGTEVNTDLNAYTEGMEEVEESNRKGSDFSEVQDVREYRPGDRLQNIHWKLSAKKDLLMVKERVSMSSRQLFILMELHDNSEGLMEEILDCVYGMCRFMIRNQIPVSICWWSVTNNDLMVWKVDYEDLLEEGFRMLFYDMMYEEQTLGRDMYLAARGEEAQFLWVGNRNYGAGEPIMECGTQAGVFYGTVS